ncbi:MAG: phosphoglycerate kinase [Patescibacteria group bacterium]
MGYIFPKKTVQDVDISGKRVLVRADYNVPLNDDGSVANDFRISSSVPTLEYLMHQGCKITVMSHLGRPKGQVVSSMSLAPVYRHLVSIFGKDKVSFADDCTSSEALKASKNLEPSQIMLLENTRFHAGDEAGDPELAKTLAKYGEIFVQDCFGTAHRSHASVTGVAEILPSVAGLLLEREVVSINEAMHAPERPLVAIIGGAKISDKIDLIQRFMDKADFIGIGGAMANTFLAAEGVPIGKSMYEPDEIEHAKTILAEARRREKEGSLSFFVPMDGVVARDIDSNAKTRIVDWGSGTTADMSAYPAHPKKSAYTVDEDEMILDTGPFSAAYIAGAVQMAGTVIWNGTMGVTETQPVRGHEWGPFEIADIKLHESLTGFDGRRPKVIVGGGDTASFVLGLEHHDLYDHVSTGGGASMDLMSGKKLPGVEVLQDKE